MSYVATNLLPTETIIHQGEVHWFVFVPGATYFVIGMLLFNTGTEGADTWGTIFVLVATFSLIRAFVHWLTTELAVTNKRVIAKVGLIRRQTVELNHAKVESFEVNQGVFGRIFNYGTVTVCGTGGNKTGVRNIRAPMDFRRRAMGASDTAQGAVT